MPGRSAAAQQALDRRHQLFGALLPLLALAAGDAVRGVVGEQLEGDLVECRLDRRHLGDYVDAVAVVLDHSLDPADLPLDPAQALEDRVLVLGVAVSYRRVCGHAPILSYPQGV